MNFWKAMKEWFLAIWTLPQTVLGLIVQLVTKAKPCKKWIDGVGYDFYIATRFNRYWSGVSLGDFIIFADETCVGNNSIKHEYGHCIQSNYFGWFYLLIVGIPSVIGNLWDRVAHKDWTYTLRERWYYSRFPENMADKLGGVDRGF